MQRQIARAEQLHLELQYDYLKWLNLTGEEVDSYEIITTRFLKNQPSFIGIGDSPYWKELARAGANNVT